MYLDPGESMSIGFESIPEGYTLNDLVYEIEDSSVCSVSNGIVTAKESGSTILKIKTKDGMLTAAMIIVVNYDYSLPEFESL